MASRVFLAGLALAATAVAQPLPQLRIEPVPAGSIFYVKNTAPQPVTAFLIELVNYPGSSFTMLEDEFGPELIAAGAEKKIPVTNMTVGAVPDYVKLEAALFADGRSAGIPEKVAQIVDRRRAILTTVRELVARVEKKATAADLSQWADSLKPAGKRAAASPAQLEVSRTATYLESHTPAETLTRLREKEKLLAASKPAL